MERAKIIDDVENKNEEINKEKFIILSEEEKKLLDSIDEEKKINWWQFKKAKAKIQIGKSDDNSDMQQFDVYDDVIKGIIFASLPKELQNATDKINLQKVTSGSSITYAENKEIARQVSDIMGKHFNKSASNSKSNTPDTSKVETQKVNLEKLLKFAKDRKDIVQVRKVQVSGGIILFIELHCQPEELEKNIAEFENSMKQKGENAKEKANEFNQCQQTKTNIEPFL